MEVTIHGAKVQYYYEQCGIYKSRDGTLGLWGYAVMDISQLTRVINSMGKKEAILAVEKLRDDTDRQSKLKSAPKNIGYPVLLGPQPTPIDEVRQYIANTKEFCDRVLAALKGE